MNVIRKILGTLLMLVLLLNIIPAAGAEETDTGKLRMTASGTAVHHGDTVTVTISSSRGFVTRGAGMTVSYDETALEPLLADSTTKEGFRLSGPMTVNGKTVLRISSFPGTEGRTVQEDEPLAVLAFRTIAPGENIRVEMTAAYLYDSDLNRIHLQIPEPVQISAATIPVTGITLEYDAMDLEIDTTRQLGAVITPENASDKTILWTSSDETKVSVADGVLTGLAITEEPVRITASVGGFTAECMVNVVYPPDAGYIITMPEDKAAVVGDTVSISPTIGNAQELTVYNAYDITLSYDPSMLLLLSEQVENTTLTQGHGTVNLLHYGPDKSIGTSPFTLTFKALKTGTAQVEVVAARVDHSQNAVISNAAKASAYPAETKITIGGYPVVLPDDFTGGAVVEPGTDYTFAAKDKLYDYVFEGSTMGGQDVTVRDNADGTFTIENVTGKLEIRSQKVGKTFAVVFDGSGKADMKGNSTARYMTDYSATLQEEDNYTYKLHISIDGNGYTGYSRSADTYTIPGKDITGKIIFTVTKTAAGINPPSGTWYDVVFQGNGAGAVTENSTSAASGSSYSFTLNKEAGYRYGVTYQMGEEEETTVRPDGDGVYTIYKVSGDLVITVTKELDVQDYSIEVSNYITLNHGKTIYLVLIRGGLDDSKIYTYAGNPMYYSDVYKAWCILTVESGKLTAGLARKEISDQTGQMDVIASAAFDVNMTGLVDINDAQITYDLYNGKYENFAIINMQRFLNADVNADKKVTVADTAAVVAAIK